MLEIRAYLQTLQASLDTGAATEHTHRPALQALLEKLLPDCRIINEPRHIEAGALDFEIRRADVPIGWIEAKDIGMNLDKIQDSEQLRRYREALSNLILTDYLEFRYFYHGELQADLTVRLAELSGKKLRTLDEALPKLQTLFTRFSMAQAVTLNNPHDLAQRMAKIARLITQLTLTAYEKETSGGFLHGQLDSFRDVLLDSLKPQEFADMYAQTVCYGLFAAKCALIGEKLSRYNAAHSIPKTNPFLRHLFDQIAGIDMDERMAWAVEYLIDVLNRADIAAILADFGRRTRREDPVVHFYETFLAAYDPKLREVRGVYYTPEPVVSYIVRSLDSVLKSHFGLKEGLACKDKLENGVHKVQILDPATGTGTFLYALFNLIYQRFIFPANKKGMWPSYVQEHLLPRVHGFEFLMAPYTVAHMKLGLQLQETGYKFDADERLRLFLTNTLEEARSNTHSLMAKWLSKEAKSANEIKSETPVMVILGNPPYSGHSANTGAWIRELIHDYKKNCPELSKPAQAKWLQDDYIKFIRFAQWKISQTGYGILGFVTNHGYLDNPTFRGMRQLLIQDFDEIYILDLHGNSKKREKTPDGSADKNVFDIQQGVAIGIFIKHKNKKLVDSENAHGLAKVFHAELLGNRVGKYAWLYEKELNTTKWTNLKPDAPFYLFVPQNQESHEEYNKYWSLVNIMNKNGDPAPGIVTTHDEFAISWTKKEANSKVEKFLNTSSESEARDLFRLCSQNQWNYENAKKSLSIDSWRKKVMPILYRPFDIKWTVYNSHVAVHRRERVMQHMLQGENIGLITCRQQSQKNLGWGLVGVTNIIIESCAISNKTKEINSLFPLYLYPDKTDNFLNGNGNGNGHHKELSRKPNFSEGFIKDLETRLHLKFIPEGRGDFTQTISAQDVFYYMYAVFHSPTYRSRYAEFLKMDFPRLPLAADVGLFAELAELGAELAQIHLMKADLDLAIGYPIEGSSLVEKAEYKENRIYINKTQYFEPVDKEVWEFHIGGYQVAHKWLKDRKGKTLSSDELAHYMYVLVALKKTIELMEKIDEIIDFPLQ